MALLTALPLEKARRIGALYGLDVEAARPLLAGSVNSNVELALAGGGRAFLRIYEEQTADSAAVEARLLEHLAARGVATPRPLSTTADPAIFIAEHAGKPVAVFPWIGGEALCQARVTPEAARTIGAALARVHVAGASFEGAPPSRFGAPQLAERIERLRASPLPDDLPEVLARLADRLARLPERELPERGVAHGDLFRDNVLWEGGEITALLDFESASRESLPFDVMVTLLAWCFTDRLDRELARSLIAGYGSVRPLPEAETARLHDEGSFAALRFAITRITDFELRPRGTGVYKDYRRFLARQGALDALGPAGLVTFLGL